MIVGSKMLVPWLLATPPSSLSFQANHNGAKMTATELAREFQQVYQRLEHSSNVMLIPPRSPTLKFQSLTLSSSSSTLSFKEESTSSTSPTATSSHDHNNNNRPLVLYLPGLDGYGVSAYTNQFEDLRRAFDFWHLTIDRYDRSSFSDLMQAVTWFLEQRSHQAQQQNVDDHHSLFNQTMTRQRVYLIGESFGGLLAPAVALQVKQKAAAAAAQRTKPKLDSFPPPPAVVIDGMVLVNPATSFSQSNWDVVGSLMGLLDDDGSQPSASSSTLLPSFYSFIGGSLLAATVPSTRQSQRFFQDILFQIPRATPTDWMDIGQGMKQSFDSLQYRLPGTTVQHRIREWLLVGDAIVTPNRWKSIQIPTLIVVGKEDTMLPSLAHAKELERLSNLPSSSSSSKRQQQQQQQQSLCETIVIPDAGHFVLDDRVNLTNAMIQSKVLDPLRIWATQPPYDPITDWKRPSQEDIDAIVQQGVEPLRKLFSPVFFSTDPKTGRRWKGLSKLPSLRQKQQVKNDDTLDDDDDPSTVTTEPVLIVANHQFAGFDLGMVVSQLMEERNWTVRGLAHPFLFQPFNGSDGDSSAEATWRSSRHRASGNDETNTNSSPLSVFSPTIMRKFGAVLVTPRNYYRLLETGQQVLLFPGGVREVFHGRNEAYQIFWPEKPDFVRTAAKFNATIIPLCGIGMADTFQILLDSSELTQLPIIGERIRQQSSQVTAARFDALQEEELFQPPLAIPSLPARNYFLFGRPISTKHISHRDRDACAALYQQVREEMRKGLADLVAAREHDPFQNTPQRYVYEQVTGKQAPTFPVDVLNNHRKQ